MHNNEDFINVTEVRNNLKRDVVSYLTQCRIPADFINPRLVYLALEASYRPQRMFWRALDRATVLDALESYAPNFRNSLMFVENKPYEILLDRIDFMLAVRFSDESNAEILLSVPDSERPSTPKDAFKFLRRELVKRGNLDEARYLLADREKGAADALELVEAQLATREGRPFMTEHAEEAMMTLHRFVITLPFEDDGSGCKSYAELAW